MDSETRPGAVTYAAAAVILGALSLVVTAFWQASMLQSLSMRTEVQSMLAGRPSDLGFTVDGWLRAVKVLGMVCAACAVASAILGWQALQRSRAARVGLLALVGPLFLSGLVVQPLFAALVGAGVLVLWLPRSNAWFRPAASGRMQPMSEAPPPGPYDPHGQQNPPPPYQPPFGAPPTPSGEPPASPASPAPPAPPAGSAPAASSGDPANPYGNPYANPYANPYGGPYGQPHTQAYAQPYPYPPGGRAPDARPATVSAAAVITLVLAGLTAAIGLLMAIVGHAEADEAYRAFRDAGREMRGITEDELAKGFVIVGVILVVASAAAIAAAVFVLRRSRAARVLLTILAVLTVLLSLLLITTLVSLITLAGAIATIVLLYSGGANAWFTRRPPQPPLPQPPYPGAPWPGA